ncbi:hypothetical protein [Nitrosopumilus sp.]|uniref:hypothetical protein n=1 Tax=Nitrosopumilus sp. TaxID=2024843 RepID=UPI002624D4DD|nr:hypothetical protein [Nitrosopumilus sp.]
MEDDDLEKILEKLNSKKRDCESFSKKYEVRKMDDLFQYYEGAKWAIEFAISVIENKDSKQ